MSFALRGFHLAALLGLVTMGTALGQADNPPPDPNFRLPGQMPAQRVADPNTPPAFVVPQTPAQNSPYMTPVRPLGAQGTLNSPYLGGSGAGNLVNPGAAYSQPNYNPYYNPYVPNYDPYGGALTGLANVINAQSQAWVTIQGARIVRQQGNQAMLDTRRRLFDQIRYERMSMPTPEDIRIRDMELSLNKARRNPPLVEVWSGEALNSLLNYLIKQQGAGYKGPRVDLDEEMLRQINVNTGTGGNIGVLKDGGKLQWPLSLQRPEYDEARKTLSSLLPEAVQQVQFGNALGVNIRQDILTGLKNLSDTLDKNAKSDLPPSQYLESRAFLNQVNEGFKALQQPDATNYFNNKWTAKGKTVAELIKYMDEKGLRFAPVTPGGEGPYRALLNALNSYDSGMMQASRP